MEDAGTSEEDDIDSQDSNSPIEHGHLARNCSIKIMLSIYKIWNIQYKNSEILAITKEISKFKTQSQCPLINLQILLLEYLLLLNK